jgi:hypothetical protein
MRCRQRLFSGCVCANPNPQGFQVFVRSLESRLCCVSDPNPIRITLGWDIFECRPRLGRYFLYNATALACHGFETYGSEYKTEHGIANRPYGEGYKKYEEETDTLPGQPRLL